MGGDKPRVRTPVSRENAGQLGPGSGAELLRISEEVTAWTLSTPHPSRSCREATGAAHTRRRELYCSRVPAANVPPRHSSDAPYTVNSQADTWLAARITHHSTYNS